MNRKMFRWPAAASFLVAFGCSTLVLAMGAATPTWAGDNPVVDISITESDTGTIYTNEVFTYAIWIINDSTRDIPLDQVQMRLDSRVFKRDSTTLFLYEKTHSDGTIAFSQWMPLFTESIYDTFGTYTLGFHAYFVTGASSYDGVLRPGERIYFEIPRVSVATSGTKTMGLIAPIQWDADTEITVDLTHRTTISSYTVPSFKFIW